MKSSDFNRVARRETASTAIIWLERVWSATWPTSGIIALFLSVALLDLLPKLPAWLHAFILAGFAVAVAWSLARQIHRLRSPDRQDGRRRLERVNNLSHRPLTVLREELAAGESVGTIALWRLHQSRIAAKLARLRLGWPKSLLPRRDPRAFRLAAALILIVGLFSGGSDAGARLLRAIDPEFAATNTGEPVAADIQVTPPDYTNVSPIFFDGAVADGAAIGVPSGSRILVQVHNSANQPSFTVINREQRLEQFAKQTWRAETVVESDQRIPTELTVTLDGDQLIQLPIIIVPDEPPLITFATPPSATPRAALRLHFTVADDYGVERVQADITRPEASATGAVRSIELNLPLSGRQPVDDSGTSFQDLTAHPWAGLPVEIRLSAVDIAGLVGVSDPVALILPERIFEHPIARAIIEERRDLTLAPETRDQVAENLRSIAEARDYYGNDIVVQLSLSVAGSRLTHDRSDTAIDDVLSILWDTALRIEDGDLTLAERELRELQRRLQEALANDTSDEDLDRLLDELQTALDRFFQAALENLQRQLEQGQLQQMDPNALAVGREDLQRMVEQMRELSQLGARDAARQMLSQLQEMLENLQNGAMAAQRPQGPSPGQELMQDLQDVMRGQQELLDQTFRQSQQSNQPPQDGGAADAGVQEQLRRDLGDVMRRLGEMAGDIPGQLGRAERAMRDSTQSLSEGQPGQALGPQQEALDQLQQGAQAAFRALAQQQPGGPGQFGQLPGQFGNVNPNSDPLGRPLNGANGLDTGRVQIPDQADIQRARQILDELRRRSGQGSRPIIERNYIDRLLRRF